MRRLFSIPNALHPATPPGAKFATLGVYTLLLLVVPLAVVEFVTTDAHPAFSYLFFCGSVLHLTCVLASTVCSRWETRLYEAIQYVRANPQSAMEQFEWLLEQQEKHS